MSPFKVLGVSRDATIVEIKRAYAAKLKRTRPEDDAAGFQRLREAFQAALAHATHRDAAAADDYDVFEDDDEEFDEAGDPGAVAGPPPSPGPDASDDVTPDVPVAHDAGESPAIPLPDRVPTFDFPRFVTELQQAGDGDLASFERWLANHPDLYSLSLKDNLVWPLMHYLADAERPLLPKWLAALLHFLRLDTVASRPYALDQLISTAQRHAEDYWRPDAIAYRYQDGRGSFMERAFLRDLKGPTRTGWRMVLVTWPGLRGTLWNIASDIAQSPREYQARVFDPQAVQFWLQAADPGRIGSHRLTLYTIVAAILASLAIWAGGTATVAYLILLALVYGGWLARTANEAWQVRKVRRAVAEGRPPAAPSQWNWRLIFFALFILAQLGRFLS